MTKPLLVQFLDLTASDFAKHAVWVSCHIADYEEPWYEETDEETFRPWLGPLPVVPSNDTYIARGLCRLSNGVILKGFLFTSNGLEISDIQPHVFLPSGKFWRFWEGMVASSSADKQEFYSQLKLNHDEIFPITAIISPGLSTGTQQIVIAGFYSQREGQVIISK